MSHPEACLQQVFVIAVTWKFKNQADKNKLIQLWKPLAAYVASHEPNTLAYEMSFSEDEPLTVFLYERYICFSSLCPMC